MEKTFIKIAKDSGFNLTKVGYEKYFKYVFTKTEFTEADKEKIKTLFKSEIGGFGRKKKIFSLINNVFFMDKKFIDS